MEGILTSHGMWRFRRTRRVPIIWQAEAGECGLACLAMCNAYHGIHINLKQLRERFGNAGRGASIKQLRAIALQCGLRGQVYSIDLTQLSRAKGPVVLHWDFNHFVVFVGKRFGRYVIHDPGRGERWLSRAEVSRHFTGIAMLLEAEVAAVETPKPPRLTIRRLLYSTTVASQVGALVALSIILQACLLLSPLYIQTVVDDVVLRVDHTLLTSLALGFGLLLVFQTALQYVRDTAVLRFAAALQLQFGQRLFHHLMALPLRFFSARHIGDVQSRFNAIDYFREVLSQQLAISLVDGLLALASMLAMFAYSPLLSSVVILTSGVSMGLVWACSWWIRRAQQRAIQDRAELDGHFIESVTHIQTIAQLGWRLERSAQWCEKLQDFNGADVQAKLWQLRLDTIVRGVQGGEHILLIYLAAQAVMADQLTVGMLFAFLAYKGRFSTASQGLISALITLRMLPMYRERLEDIALTERQGDCYLFDHPQSALLQVSQPSFALELLEGECVAIAGRSGGGKSTLMRQLLGLETEAGCIRWACPRHEVAAVLQGDSLLSGSLRDNICSFSASLDPQWLQQVCRIAGVDSLLTDLPMGLETVVGEYGHALSAGQNQRVQIARALYRKPRVLLLDEATSHLDVAAEKRLMAALRDPDLGLSILMVAHRPDCLAAADRVVALNGPSPAFSS